MAAPSMCSVKCGNSSQLDHCHSCTCWSAGLFDEVHPEEPVSYIPMKVIREEMNLIASLITSNIKSSGKPLLDSEQIQKHTNTISTAISEAIEKLANQIYQKYYQKPFFEEKRAEKRKNTDEVKFDEENKTSSNSSSGSPQTKCAKDEGAWVEIKDVSQFKNPNQGIQETELVISNVKNIQYTNEEVVDLTLAIMDHDYVINPRAETSFKDIVAYKEITSSQDSEDTVSIENEDIISHDKESTLKMSTNIELNENIIGPEYAANENLSDYHLVDDLNESMLDEVEVEKDSIQRQDSDSKIISQRELIDAIDKAIATADLDVFETDNKSKNNSCADVFETGDRSWNNPYLEILEQTFEVTTSESQLLEDQDQQSQNSNQNTSDSLNVNENTTHTKDNSSWEIVGLSDAILKTKEHTSKIAEKFDSFTMQVEKSDLPQLMKMIDASKRDEFNVIYHRSHKDTLQVTFEANQRDIDEFHKKVNKEFRGSYLVKKINRRPKIIRVIEDGRSDANIDEVEVRDFIVRNCATCGQTFDSLKSLRTHELSHSDSKAFRCKYEGCEERFQTDEGLAQHQFSEHEGPPYACRYCSFIGRRMKNVKRHEKRHFQEKIHCCRICYKSFGSVNILKSHMLTHEEKTLKCSYCPKMFRKKAQVDQHERIHTGEKPYKCKVCDKRFAALLSRDFHQMKHTNQRPFQCTFCHKRFSTPLATRNHIENKHVSKNSGVKYECELCHKRYNSKLSLKNHWQRFHVTSYPCTECKEVFPIMIALKRHLYIEHNIGNKEDVNIGVCKYCGKIFHQDKYLPNHEERCKKEQGYAPCPICNAYFSEKNMRAHVKNSHANHPEAEKLLTASNEGRELENLVKVNLKEREEFKQYLKNCGSRDEGLSKFREKLQSSADFTYSTSERLYNEYRCMRKEESNPKFEAVLDKMKAEKLLLKAKEQENLLKVKEKEEFENLKKRESQERLNKFREKLQRSADFTHNIEKFKNEYRNIRKEESNPKFEAVLEKLRQKRTGDDGTKIGQIQAVPTFQGGLFLQNAVTPTTGMKIGLNQNISALQGNFLIQNPLLPTIPVLAPNICVQPTFYRCEKCTVAFPSIQAFHQHAPLCVKTN